MRSKTHPDMWAMNQLYVEGRHADLTADVLTAELDRGLPGARHRRAVVTDDATGRAVAEGMRAAGYAVGPLAVMLLDRDPPAPRPGAAHEIGREAARALQTRIADADPSLPEHDRSVVVEGRAHMRATIPGSRSFAGVDDDVDVCSVTLYTDGATAQPEDVETLTSHRSRGLAASTVSLAVREARAAGCDLVFIVCNAATGPFPLYARLGFRAAGRFWTFNRPA